MTIVMAGGGTGGHLMPALAVASALRVESPGARIIFVGTEKGMEAARAPAAGYPFFAVRGAQVKGVGILRAIEGLFSAMMGVLDARGVMKNEKPDAVVCVGGYASFAAGVAARLSGIPLFALEQNAIPGRVNRFLARFAALVVSPFDESKRLLRGRHVETLGNPVRPELLARCEAMRRQGAAGPFHVFVFGGSQGARRLNEAAKAYAEKAGGRLGKEIRMTHQTGAASYEEVRSFYESRRLDVECMAFIEDMASVYAKTSLVLCRAGATSIAELTALGLPSVLIPYPFAADDHQKANAKILQRAGAAEVVEDARWDAAVMEEIVERLRRLPEKLAAMSAAARSLGRPNAAFDVARRVLAAGGTR
jgi:UDP-N-acetylglucosamine--N-acetylmuramyl-(pentapeptide) pyrophosphoryl-undecaprenol N-acetylglucosamine transferase